MKAIEIEVKIACAQREVDYWKQVLSDRQCRKCQNWERTGCLKAGGLMPPEEVQRTGCPEWIWDMIPF